MTPIALILALFGSTLLPQTLHAQAAGAPQRAYETCIAQIEGVAADGGKYLCVPWIYNGENGFSGVQWYPADGQVYTGPGPEYQFFAYGGTSLTRNNGGACPCDSGNGSNSGDSSPSMLISGVMAGDPINTATGNAYRQDDDYVGSPWLTLRRFYNSALFATAGEWGLSGVTALIVRCH